MKTTQHVLTVLAMCIFANPVMAATRGWLIDGTNTVPNTVANALMVDGQGDDWTGAVLKLDLYHGSVYNEPGFGATGGPGDGTQDALWGFVPALRWDSAVGIAADGSAGIAGGAGDLGGGALNIGGTGVDAVSVTWFNTDTGNTGPVQIANISLTNDANGTFELIVSFAGEQLRSSGTVENGWIGGPEPTSLALMGLGALAVFRRRR